MSAPAKSLGHAGTVMRLLRDIIQPWNSLHLVWWVMLPALSTFIVDHGLDLGWLMAASMAFACAVGMVSDRVALREYRVLPVTDRDLWVTRWVNATCAVPAGLLVYKCLLLAVAAADGRTLFTAETLLLSTVFDAVYAAAFLPVPLWLDARGTALAARLGTSAFLVSLTLLFLSIPVAIAAPFFIAGSLPEHLDEFSTTGALILGLGLAVAIGALVWTPRNGGVELTDRASAPAIPRPSAKPDTGRSLQGIPLILWSHVRSTVVFSIVGLGVAFTAAPLLPGSAKGDARLTSVMFLIFAFFAMGMGNAWTLWARRLKTLPLSVNQVNGLFTLTPLVTWLVVWLLLLLAQTLAGRPIYVELSPLAVFMYAGFSALARACELRFRGVAAGETSASMVCIVAVVAIGMALFGKQALWAQLLVLAAGLLSLAAAALLNHYTLTRSTSSARVYRSPGLSMKS